jgi:enediyne biosynthesis protein E4
MTTRRRRNRWAGLITIAALLSPSTQAAEPIKSTPLAKPTGAVGTTLFVTVPPEECGISAPNAYDDPAMWKERYREFSLGAIGTGIAIGDYDGDERPDVFIVRKTGENRLFRNLGNFRFQDVTQAAGVAGPLGHWKQGASFADVNNDGWLDLYVCRYNAPNLLYLNQRDGTFREEAAARGLAVVDASSHAAFCDYDRDGDLDVYLQTNVLDSEARPNGQRDYLFRNEGDGHFANVTEKAGLFGETQGHSATWWDYNEDGWPDVYVANDFKDPDQLYRNNGDGTFTNVLSWVLPHTPHSSMGADLGDLNNDGHIDLLVADMAATTRYKDHRGMAKLRAGLPETDSKPLAAPQYMRNALYLNLGTGHTLEAAFLTGLDATDWTWAVRLEDLDNDGLLDAFFTTGMIRELHNADIVAKMIAIENISQRTIPMHSSPPLAENNIVFRNRGDLHFENTGKAWGLDHLGISFGAAFGDLDGDGDLDLIVSNYDADVFVCRNDSASGNRLMVDLRGTASNRFGIGATVRVETERGIQVKQLVNARGYLSTSEPAVHFGLGDSTTARKLTVIWPSGYEQTLENVAANQRLRVTEPRVRMEPPSLPTPRDELPKGQFVEVSSARGLSLANKEASLNELSRQPLLTLRLNRQGPSASAADLDGDGEDDLCIGGSTGESGRFLFNLGDGNFLPFGSSIFSGATQTADAGMAFFDADADGDNDLLATKGGTAKEPGNAAYQARLFLNDGTGRFTAASAEATPKTPISASGTAVADFDRDGRLDVVIAGRVIPWAYPKAADTLLWHNQGAGFADVTDALAPVLRGIGLATAAIWSDVDADGWIDLLLTTEWGYVRYLRNREGKAFEDMTDAAGFRSGGKGWWNSIAAADFNRDGYMDYVVGNLGLNTRYKATPERPAVLFAGKADPSNRVALIEAQYEGEKLYPTRPLPVLAAALPALGKKFPTYEAYAKATIEDVLPAEFLETALRLEATQFQSGVFLSNGRGRYFFNPLPRIVQTAPIFGLSAGDFDGDGKDDVCAVQNSYAPIPEVGRFDGGVGWILKGDGSGNFMPVEPRQSGFVVTGDAKALVRLDLDKDGWPDFFITRNNQRTAAFKNGGVAGHRSAAVALRGVPGNPTCIGARVTVSHADGSSQSAEVAAGTGYLSQSSPLLFFGFAENSPPKGITVRWPDGRVTQHPWTTDQARIVLSQPAP